MALCACGCGKPAPLATMSNKKFGHVKGQPVRYIHGHHARRALPDMTPVEVAWLAGLLEGEGSFCAIRKTRTPKKVDPWVQSYFKISVGMTDEDVIAKVATLWGAAFQKGKAVSGRKPIYQTSISGSKAEQVATRLEPHLGGRRQGQIRTALQKVHATQLPWPRKLKAS